MPTASPEEVRAALQLAFERAAEIAAVTPCRFPRHVDARRAATALNTLALTISGEPLNYPSGR